MSTRAAICRRCRCEYDPNSLALAATRLLPRWRSGWPWATELMGWTRRGKVPAAKSILSAHLTLLHLRTHAHTRSMPFRVLIAGGKHFTDYPLLRSTLDKLLANRLPDVELLTCGGPGVAMLAASYAAERGLTVVPMLPDMVRHRGKAVERRDADVVFQADAAVVVWGEREPDVWRLLELVKAKGMPVHVIGGPPPKVKPTSDEGVRDERRGLPD